MGGWGTRLCWRVICQWHLVKAVEDSGSVAAWLQAMCLCARAAAVPAQWQQPL